MNRYVIQRDNDGGFIVEARFVDGDILHSPSLPTEEAAEEWIDVLMRLKRRPVGPSFHYVPG